MEVKLKTTAKHFEYFKKRCLYWADRFGLNEWDLYIEHEDIKPEHDRQLFAWTDIVNDGCCARITLNKEPDDKTDLSDSVIDDTAKHEIIHILLNNLSNLVGCAYVTESEHIKIEEALVVKLCKLL